MVYRPLSMARIAFNAALQCESDAEGRFTVRSFGNSRGSRRLSADGATSCGFATRLPSLERPPAPRAWCGIGAVAFSQLAPLQGSLQANHPCGKEVSPSKGRHSRQHDQAAMRMFIEVFGRDRDPATLSQRDWDRFIQERKTGTVGPSGRPVSDRTTEYDLRFLIAVFNWAVRCGRSRAARSPGPVRVYGLLAGLLLVDTRREVC